MGFPLQLKQSSVNLSFVILTCTIYSISYFYRNSIGPIADVMEDEYSTTATMVGLLSSSIYLSYFSMQIVVGLLLEIYSFHILILISSIGLGIGIILFAISNNILLSILLRFITGFLVSAPYVTGVSIISQRYGNKYIPMYTGIAFFCGNTFLLTSTNLQAHIWETYHKWRIVYIFTGILSIFIGFIFLYFTIYEINIEIDNTQNVSNVSLKTIDSPSNIDHDIHQTSETPLMPKNITKTKRLIYRDINNMDNKSKCNKLTRSLKVTLSNKQNWILGWLCNIFILNAVYIFDL